MEIKFEQVLEMYNSGESTYQIAKHFNTYPNKIRRLLNKYGVELKSHSEAQKNALEQGIAPHPTKGKKRTEKERLAISSPLAKSWSEMPKEQREKLSEMARDRWYDMPEEKKQEIRNLGLRAVQKASREGTKFELYVKQKLEENGHSVKLHDNDLIDSECDLTIEEIKTVIEIDGGHHREPRYGQEVLEKVQAADKKKDDDLMNIGYNLIRVYYPDNDPLVVKHRLCNMVLSFVDQIKEDTELDNQIFYVGLKDE